MNRRGVQGSQNFVVYVPSVWKMIFFHSGHIRVKEFNINSYIIINEACLKISHAFISAFFMHIRNVNIYLGTHKKRRVIEKFSVSETLFSNETN